MDAEFTLLVKLIRGQLSMDTFLSIVLKLGSVIDSAGVLGHWVNGRTTESLVEPHDRTGTTQMTRLDDSVLD